MKTLPISIVPAAWLMCTALVPALYGADDAVVMSRGQFWLRAWAPRPSFSLAADADGDGRADLITFQPRGTAWVDVHLTSPLGKPTPGRRALDAVRSRRPRRRSAVGSRGGGPMTCLASSPTAPCAWPPRSTGERAGTRKSSSPRQSPCRFAARSRSAQSPGDFDGDGRTDAVLVDDDGKACCCATLPHRTARRDLPAMTPTPSCLPACAGSAPAGSDPAPVTNWCGSTARAPCCGRAGNFPVMTGPASCRPSRS